MKFLLRHGYIYSEGTYWTGKHRRWLTSLVIEDPLLKEVFDQYDTELVHAEDRLASLDKRVLELAQSQAYRRIVPLLCCFRGIDTLTAITLITELFEFGRFESPEALMNYLGLVPSEDSTGDHRRRGSITKTGNRRVRRVLIQASWNHRHAHTVSQALRKRRQGQPSWAVALAEKADRRLGRRYRALTERGKEVCKVVVAIAREFSGFIWAMLREYQKQQSKTMTG
jgi:transposase